ncbi:GNAT family N-acetyltransferase [Actinocrinis puniceicyclus]|uniref:GNAT family N-acetyltransferase n=1 Tax=Actinocrinis puniceicyclus TaxID=977794 RepID=A0A8J7WK31_9ACTN|nr:GNAT family N-acetyltransferase [Actinocrinis puniceicyclus]MBS2963733.1 GNAT family N-acetyltransferase [Actinocrinis puniceicyclus]
MTDLITTRLVLHPLTLAEAARVVGGVAGPDDVWADGFPGHGDRDAARMAVNAAKARAEARLAAVPPVQPDHDPFTCYRIDRRMDGTAIGTIGFHGPPDARRQVTIGYGLVPMSWGNGYATEAVHALIDFCRAHADVASLAADTNHDNAASQRVLVKSGFRLVRQDRELLYYELELDG